MCVCVCVCTCTHLDAISSCLGLTMTGVGDAGTSRCVVNMASLCHRAVVSGEWCEV